MCWLQEQKKHDDNKQDEETRSILKMLEINLPSNHELKYSVYSLHFPLFFRLLS